MTRKLRITLLLVCIILLQSCRHGTSIANACSEYKHYTNMFVTVYTQKIPEQIKQAGDDIFVNTGSVSVNVQIHAVYIKESVLSFCKKLVVIY